MANPPPAFIKLRLAYTFLLTPDPPGGTAIITFGPGLVRWKYLASEHAIQWTKFLASPSPNFDILVECRQTLIANEVQCDGDIWQTLTYTGPTPYVNTIHRSFTTDGYWTFFGAFGAQFEGLDFPDGRWLTAEILDAKPASYHEIFLGGTNPHDTAPTSW